MTEDDRIHLYLSLLRGISEECQKRNCAADHNHAWGEWRHTPIFDDMPIVFKPGPVSPNKIAYDIKSERCCLCCGKVQINGPAS